MLIDFVVKKNSVSEGIVQKRAEEIAGKPKKWHGEKRRDLYTILMVL